MTQANSVAFRVVFRAHRIAALLLPALFLAHRFFSRRPPGSRTVLAGLCPIVILAGLLAIGLRVVFFDYDGDRWPDLFIRNDTQPNQLLMNHRGKWFRDEALRVGVAFAEMGLSRAGMGVAESGYHTLEGGGWDLTLEGVPATSISR